MDSFWDEIDRLGLFAIPSLGAHDWHYATQNETINDLVMDRNSKSRKYAVDYIRTFTTRYSNRSSLFFWELGNKFVGESVSCSRIELASLQQLARGPGTTSYVLVTNKPLSAHL